jgi:hypothetical protein
MTRRDVVTKFPDLLGHFARSGEAVAALVEPVIRTLLTASGTASSRTSEEADQAQMLVSAAKAIIISAYLKNPSIAQSDPTSSLTAAIITFRKAIA